MAQIDLGKVVGNDGKSAYQVAVENGFIGDEQAWLNSLKGERGAPGPTYTAGVGIDITNNVISNTQTSAEWGNITGTLSNQTDLNTALSGKQETLTSGTNIKTVNNQSLLGSGNINIEENEVFIGDEQDAPESTKLLVDTEDDSWNNIGTEVVDTLSGNEANRAPSVRAVNEVLDKKVSGLFRFINAGNLNELKNTIGIVNAFALYNKSITNGPTNYDNGVQYLFIDITHKEGNNEIRCQFLAGHKKIWHRYTTTTNLGNWEQLV